MVNVIPYIKQQYADTLVQIWLHKGLILEKGLHIILLAKLIEYFQHPKLKAINYLQIVIFI
jgi:hypothetical protein